MRDARHTAVMRAVTALLVVHRIHASKHDGLEAMLTQLSAHSPGAVLGMREPVTARSAHGAVHEAVRWLARDKELAPLLHAARRRLAKPVVFLAGTSWCPGARDLDAFP